MTVRRRGRRLGHSDGRQSSRRFGPRFGNFIRLLLVSQDGVERITDVRRREHVADLGNRGRDRDRGFRSFGDRRVVMSTRFSVVTLSSRQRPGVVVNLLGDVDLGSGRRGCRLFVELQRRHVGKVETTFSAAVKNGRFLRIDAEVLVTGVAIAAVDA